ncbi:ATP-binding protein [uncultured Erythrobacter sp.]|uniref:ATP-binding protein n=1 Tax=uncultured Erythrobacter sp. TaxID=263913 RepID=UPI00261A71D3|nr:ATP-binding protein [uncultured Erythrobacter sp.]
MKRILPSSLLGQVMVSVALALLISQVVSATLLFRASEDRRENAAVTTAAFRLINGAERAKSNGGPIDRERLRAQRQRLREAGGPQADQIARDRLPLPLRYNVTEEQPLAGQSILQRDDLSDRLRVVLEREGVTPHALAVKIIPAGDDLWLQSLAERRPRLAASQEWRDRQLVVAAIQRKPDGQWEAARLLAPPRPKGAFGVVLLQTLVTFVILILILFFVIRRITQPLATLTKRVAEFSRDPDTVVELEEQGPTDTRRLIAAHNTMEARIAALLDEKDVMLGAIGHDLKTPLAALRVRIESVGNEEERGKMAASIEDITATLDDILMLARMGRKGSLDTEAVDLGALAIGVVEEFEDLGEQVIMLDPQRLVAQVQVTWIKRALRNLTSNALRYGGGAVVSMVRGESHAILRVEDSGPGIPEGALTQMLEPFTRGEASRNRATGGTGLGLTLARAIAEAHGGTVVLANRAEGGLRAEIRLPLNE